MYVYVHRINYIQIDLLYPVMIFQLCPVSSIRCPSHAGPEYRPNKGALHYPGLFNSVPNHLRSTLKFSSVKSVSLHQSSLLMIQDVAGVYVASFCNSSFHPSNPQFLNGSVPCCCLSPVAAGWLPNVAEVRSLETKVQESPTNILQGVLTGSSAEAMQCMLLEHGKILYTITQYYTILFEALLALRRS